MPDLQLRNHRDICDFVSCRWFGDLRPHARVAFGHTFKIDFTPYDDYGIEDLEDFTPYLCFAHLNL